VKPSVVETLVELPKVDEVDILKDSVVPELKLFVFCSPGSAINSVGIKLTVWELMGRDDNPDIKNKLEKINSDFFILKGY